MSLTAVKTHQSHYISIYIYSSSSTLRNNNIPKNYYVWNRLSDNDMQRMKRVKIDFQSIVLALAVSLFLFSDPFFSNLLNKQSDPEKNLDMDTNAFSYNFIITVVNVISVSLNIHYERSMNGRTKWNKRKSKVSKMLESSTSTNIESHTDYVRNSQQFWRCSRVIASSSVIKMECYSSSLCLSPSRFFFFRFDSFSLPIFNWFARMKKKTQREKSETNWEKVK